VTFSNNVVAMLDCITVLVVLEFAAAFNASVTSILMASMVCKVTSWMGWDGKGEVDA
jgi:hypothetical protein